MKEGVVVRECLQACAHHNIQILEPRMWNKNNPPPYRPEDTNVRGVAWRNNSGGAYGIRFGIPGSPDILGMFRGGRMFGIECKTDKGIMSAYQKWYHDYMRSLGLMVAVCRSYDEANSALREWLE